LEYFKILSKAVVPVTIKYGHKRPNNTPFI
jgi:hypothetical protein